ncbi:MAG: phosphatase PAP2 family protein [Candidatus Hydrothermae bacterium]|nr:phosphatase PAP2 family protein [Candidatus Hydrothermae bacterium]
MAFPSLSHLDWALLHALQGIPSASWHAAMAWLSRPGHAWVWGVVFLAAWIRSRRWAAWLELPALVLLIGVTDRLGVTLKTLFGRVRPCHLDDTVRGILGCGGRYSFPSNHALNTAALAGFAFALWPRAGMILAGLSLLVGISRVDMGVHYPSDVLAGWVIGGALGYFWGRWVGQRSRRRLPTRSSTEDTP